MTTAELYQALGVSGYEHEACWRRKMGFSIYECGLRFRAIGVRSKEIGM